MKEAVKKYAQDEMKFEVDKAARNWGDGKFSAELIKLENRIFVQVLQGQGRDALRQRLDKRKPKFHSLEGTECKYEVDSQAREGSRRFCVE